MIERSAKSNNNNKKNTNKYAGISEILCGVCVRLSVRMECGEMIYTNQAPFWHNDYVYLK